jgi:antirestriction protein ArdC
MKADALYDAVTNRIIAELEAGTPGEWKMPWKRLATSGAPKSVSSGKGYRGINWWILGLAQQDRGYRSNWWATFNQWKEQLPEGAQVVRKGEKAEHVFLWKPTKRKDRETGEERDSLFATTFAVFNADQIVDPPARFVVPPPVLTEHERIEACEAYFEAIGATVRVGGDRAYYAQVTDHIAVPTLSQFTNPEHYYSTLAHEHVHMTGHTSRLKRDLRGRFGDESYAMEELVAELGAAFFSAQMDIDQATRLDHTSYLANWLKVLKSDRKAIVTAAARASDAIEWLNKAADWQATTKELEPA